MAIGFNAEYEIVEVAGANLNQGSNAVHVNTYLAGGGVVRRFGVVAEATQGILASSVLALRVSYDGGATFTELATLTPGATARGIPVVNTLSTKTAARLSPGALLQVVDKTAGGGTSTGRVWMEIQREPLNGTSAPSNLVEKTS